MVFACVSIEPMVKHLSSSGGKSEKNIFVGIVNGFVLDGYG